MDSITGISLFSGAGGLDIGLSIALPGIRWLCHVEREAYAASILAARMEDKTLDAAPVWSDVATFDGKPWNGKVDFIAGGFPCTDLSLAGKRAGINGAASGLWFEYVRIVSEVSPRWFFVENVPGVISARAAPAILSEIAALGYDAEWTTLRASEVGASHQRKRVFILAYKPGERLGKARNGSRRSTSRSAWESDKLVHPAGVRQCGPCEKRAENKRNAGRVCELAGAGGPLADAQISNAGESKGWNGWEGIGGGSSPFPPGPGNTEAWRQIDKALKPALCGMDDGLAAPLHERRHRLRATGNGVVALQAAVAFRLLMRRAMT